MKPEAVIPLVGIGAAAVGLALFAYMTRERMKRPVVVLNPS